MTREEIHNDFNEVRNLLVKYADYIWAPQEGQPWHFDSQPKTAQIAFIDLRIGLYTAKVALEHLLDCEDTIKFENNGRNKQRKGV